MVIAKISGRNIAIKAAQVSDFVLSGQSAVLMCEVPGIGASIDKAILEDLGRNANADLYIFNQMQI